ncbi:unnamed protein product, partial [Rotaria socialis]
MSSMNYNNYNNQLPFQSTTTAPPPPPVQRYMNNQRRGDAIYRNNQYNYQYRNSIPKRNYNNDFYSLRNNTDNNFSNRQNNNNNNIFYNRNFQQRHNRYSMNNGSMQSYYNYNNRPPIFQSRFNLNRRINRSRSSEQRRSGPRQLRLNDFMPTQLRDTSPVLANLPSNFNLNTDPTTTATRPNPPANALPQRPKFATQTQTITAASHNTTQPFIVNVDTNVLDQQQQQSSQQRPTTNTSTRRRQNRRNRQQQCHNTADNYNQNYNRFTELSDAETCADIESNYDDDISDAAPLINKTNNNNKMKQQTEQNSSNKKKKRSYLEPNRIMRYMQDNASAIINSRGNQAYILASTTIYDDWIRNNYDLQVWENYLKMGTDDKHWAKEVIKGTKKRDDIINGRFVKKKINRLTTNITQASANISNLQVQLTTYWTQTVTSAITSTTSATTNSNRTRDPADRLEKFILKYIHNCTQHVKRMAENKILLARAEMEEYKALEHFEQIASPTQWNAHLFLKPKMKQWSTKNKNYLAATKRVEYDLPPKFISNIDFTFKIDESIFNKDEAQTLYNQMRQLTKDYRTQAMSLYLQSTTREQEIL